MAHFENRTLIWEYAYMFIFPTIFDDPFMIFCPVMFSDIKKFVRDLHRKTYAKCHSKRSRRLVATTVTHTHEH